MNYSKSISLECPYCNTKCQFAQVSHTFCINDHLHHIAYVCTSCKGLITTKWRATTEEVPSFEKFSDKYEQHLNIYYPIVGDWKPRVNLSLITNEEVRNDFKEAMDCYNNGFYNACMMMARRAIQQEMLLKNAKGENLYKQIESIGISRKLKMLLHKIKNFGNYGAHPDFCLYNENENLITDKKEFSKLSLEFLDRYFADEYEIESLIEKAPKTKRELETNNN